ncbi:MAG: beta-ketoacyl-[acyl-carrier-protein] synthase family protein [Halioglobus sp.]
MQALAISHYTLSSALGVGIDAQLSALREGRSGLGECHFDRGAELATYVGEVGGVDDASLPPALADFDCRNNRLAAIGLSADGFDTAVSQAVQRYGSDRIGVYVGTSTAGIYQTELAYRELPENNDALPDWYNYAGTHNTYSIADFVRQFLGLQGPAAAISTACSSSAKVFASAHRAIAAGYCDAAVVGGVDSLCLTTLFGFHALQLVAEDVCRPMDSERRGLSIGEAAGFALLERDHDGTRMRLLGYGESGDAHHMSAPHPEGLGAIAAMQAALARAELAPGQVDYINLHGTGTAANDLAESRAVSELFGTVTPCSSTKGFTGHTLGAAGIAEAVFCLLAMEHGFMPQSLHCRHLDPDIACNVIRECRPAALRHVLTNSFGFGGSNCSLLLGMNSAMGG